MESFLPQRAGLSPLFILLTVIGLTVFFLLIKPLFVPISHALPEWELLDLSISDFILHSKAPEIPLTDTQVEEISSLYYDGLEFNENPDDPCRRLKLTSFKKLNKWINQFKQRGFTVSKIRETLAIGSRTVYQHPSGSNFTRIIHPDGSSIIVDFVNCMIWQIAPANFKF